MRAQPTDGTWAPPGIVACLGCWKSWSAGRCYLQCFECGHVYRTRWHLLAAYRWLRWQGWYRWGWMADQGFWSGLLGGWWRPSKIFFCQCCNHDF